MHGSVFLACSTLYEFSLSSLNRPMDHISYLYLSQNGSASSGARQSSTTGKDSSRPGAKGPKSAASTTSTQRATIEINSANFPPLQNSHTSAEDGLIPTPGYDGPFLKYSFDDIINIVKDIKEPSLPASIKPVSLSTHSTTHSAYCSTATLSSQ